MDSRTVFWWRWLTCAALLVLGFGLALVFAASPMQVAFESLYYTPSAPSPLSPDAVTYTAFMGAVMGATMIGWSVLLLFVLRGPFRRMETTAWQMITISLATWFISDTAASLWFGFWQNAVLNTTVLMLFAIPLLATRGSFHQART